LAGERLIWRDWAFQLAGVSRRRCPGRVAWRSGEGSSQVGEVPEWVGTGEGRFVADGDSSAVVRRAISADLRSCAQSALSLWAAPEGSFWSAVWDAGRWQA